MQDRINSFVGLGNYFQKIVAYYQDKNHFNNIDTEYIETIINKATIENPWFTQEHILYTFSAWANLLSREKLDQWVAAYNFAHIKPKKIGLVTAGNIPLVGLHDVISILISGHHLVVKPSSQDRKLLQLVIDFIENQDDTFQNKITVTEQKLQGFDAIIATGSNNTALYFESYFGKYPHIIRKNRNAVAVLSGNESPTDLQHLADDIFLYFGLGCRSVSKIFIPKNYDLNLVFNAIFHRQAIIHHHKYKNNYDYNQAVYLLNGEKLLENGFILCKEDPNYASPIAVLFYEYYNDLQQVTDKLQQDQELIQCVVGTVNLPNIVPFGKVQQPELWDYADGVDTLKFLSEL